MPRNGKKTHALRGNSSVPRYRVDEAIAWLAGRQNGRVARRQLIALGISERSIEERIRRGTLRRLHHGVYAVGHSASNNSARVRAALLAIGDDAIASHLTAAGEWGFAGSPVVIDVTSPRKLPRRDGIRLHRRVIDPAEIRLLRGLPLTSPAQTLFDLGAMLGAASHAKAANEAFVLQLHTIADLYETQARNAGRKGASAFRRLLSTLDPGGREIRSPLEARLNSFLRARGFPPWESNVPIRVGSETMRPDVLWRPQRVIVEADGRDPHLAPLTFASDRRRDRRLRVEGWEPVRVTSRDLDTGADELASDLRALLGRA